MPQQSVNQQIIRIDFYVSGNDSTVTLDSLSALYTGSANTIDTNKIRLYQTSDTVFDVSALLGTAAYNAGTFQFQNLNYQIPSGQSSVWITVNILGTAASGSEVGAEIPANSININGITYPSTSQNPQVFRKVISSIFYDNFDGTTIPAWNCSPLSLTNGWEIGPPQPLTVSNLVGYPHPANAYSFPNVLGTNLNNAVYQKGLPDHGWQAISPPGAINARYFKNTSLSFEQYLDIDASDNAYIDFSTDSGTTWTQLFWTSNSLYVDDSWNLIQFNTKNIFDRKNNIMLRYSLGKTDSTGWRLSGWCVDDVFITGNYISYDLALTGILSPVSSCGMSNKENVTIRINNTGPNLVNQPISVKYTLNIGTVAISYTDTVNIINFLPNRDTIIGLSKTFDLSRVGNYTLKCQLFFSKDSDNRNDTLSASIFSIPYYNLPRTDNFGREATYWTSGGIYDTLGKGIYNSWLLEPPDGALIAFPPPGGKFVWWTNRSDGGGAEESYVESPCYNFSGITNPVFSFQYFCFTDSFTDGILHCILPLTMAKPGIIFRKTNTALTGTGITGRCRCLEMKMVLQA